MIITLVLHGSSGLWAGFVSNAIGDTLDSLIQVLVYLFAITLAKQGKAPVAWAWGFSMAPCSWVCFWQPLRGERMAGPAAASSEVAFLSALICLVALKLALWRPSANRLKCGRWLRRVRMRLSTHSWWVRTAGYPPVSNT